MSLIQFNQLSDVDIYYCFTVLYIFAIRNLYVIFWKTATDSNTTI